jgi:two-component system chemotaxis response regulator CheB
MMCSTLTLNNAEIALKAMAIGALDYIAKPTSATEVNSSDDFRTQLIHKVKSIQTGNVRAKQPQIIGGMPVPDKEIALRPAPPLHWKPKVIAVGSSTGGPQALLEFMKGMGGMKVPIVITQHMPPTFTTLLAKNITNTCGIPCHEAEDDMPLKAGEAILARGGKHMIFEKTASGVKVKLSDTPPENFCKPAVDPMIRSLMEQYSSNIVTVMLTGMGHDGQKSVKELVDKGGYAIAQDQGTSVVWGMPGAIAMDGSCSAVLPLTDLAPWIKQHVNF